mmetsp:Transcript_52746/g.110060  ORF Transcript_52746/g.110060 Transcript_52746/m.110060 type:complete len:198 (-) Transcript_52746:114-707(-)
MMGNRLPLVRMGWRVLPLLEHLKVDEVDQIFKLSQNRIFEAGQDLMTEGCSAGSLFLVEEGSLEITRRRKKEVQPKPDDTLVGPGCSADELLHSNMSDRDIIVLLDAPAVVGEMEMLTQEPRMTSVTATNKVKAREVRYKSLEQLMALHVEIGYKVMTNIASVAANSVAQMNQQMINCNAALDLYATSSAGPASHCR